MIAIEIREPGEPEVLVPAERPIPAPASGEVLIRVAAAGVNRPDVFQRRGRYAPPPGASDIPGLEVSGVIEAVGAGVNDWKIGDAVCALVTGGGYAEYCVAPAPQCLPLPSGMDLVTAAAIPETFFTVWTNVFQRGRLQPGESLLVHGGSSGIGTTAIQLARGERIARLRDRRIDGQVRRLRAARRRALHQLPRRRLCRGGSRGHRRSGVDVILDMVGGDYFARNLDALAVEGRLVEIATLHGVKAELNIQAIMGRRLTITGSTLRPRPIADKAAIAAELQREVWPLLESGAVKPIVHATFPLREAAAAHRMMESSAHIGKLLLVTASIE